METRAQTRKFNDVVSFSGSFMCGPGDSDPSPHQRKKVNDVPNISLCEITLQVGRKQLAAAQQEDLTLSECIVVADNARSNDSKVMFFWDGEVLMREWESTDKVCQIMIPKGFCDQILNLAHDYVLSGHSGIRKTYQRILRYYFWPGMKADVAAYCRSCNVCQVVGKPNQKIPAAPLHPIPVMGEPFERILIDCVGTLPKPKSGHQYILTMMSTATCFLEAIPLRSIREKVVVKEIITFCSKFGLPKVIQTDQGSNFISSLFTQVLRELGVKHQLSRAYHPESQRALERFHQTLKMMLRAFLCGNRQRLG